MEAKRLFLGMEIVAPWPASLPDGRIILPQDRHLTLIHLGNADLPAIQKLLQGLPSPGFHIGFAGMFERVIFLPPNRPSVAAWRVRFLGNVDPFFEFRERLVKWLKHYGVVLRKEKKSFIPHVSIARRPFSISEWKKAFHPLPLYIKNIRLCESPGFSRYETCWSHEILAPFEEREHTADLLFLIRGVDESQLYLHAALALAFRFSPIIKYIRAEQIKSFDDLVIQLNRLISVVDQKEGCPFKAVSFHDKIEKRLNNIWEWEMLVDV